MRPRVIPADDAVRSGEVFAQLTASMRPRVIPADDNWGVLYSQHPIEGFNEAAGDTRG